MCALVTRGTAPSFLFFSGKFLNSLAPFARMIILSAACFRALLTNPGYSTVTGVYRLGGGGHKGPCPLLKKWGKGEC